jgi:membrane protease YdiL (CAAX protease family)
MTRATLPAAAARPTATFAETSRVRVRTGLALYFVLAYGFTWLCWGLVAPAARGLFRLPIPTDLLLLAGGLGPLLAAVAVLSLEARGAGLRALLGQLLRWHVSPVWYAVALLGWGAVDGVLVLLNVLLGGGVPPAPPLSSWLSLPAAFVITALLHGGLDEEVGWRGLALPRLQARYGALAASLVLGLIWATWHLPLWFIPGSGQEGQSFPVFVVSVLMLSVVLAWLYNNTGGSLLLVVLAHSANNVTFNLFGQAVAAMPPEALKLTPLVGDVLLPLVVIALVAGLTDPRTFRARERALAEVRS